MTELRTPDHSRNMKLIGHSDINGRGDGLQLMVHRGHAYIGHPWSRGISIVDVSDPKRPGAVTYVPAPPNTWNIHLQTHDDLLLVINALDLFADVDTFRGEKAYYTTSAGETVASRKAERSWTAGMTVYDISQPHNPRRIGQLDVDGIGAAGTSAPVSTGRNGSEISKARIPAFCHVAKIRVSETNEPGRFS